MNELIFFFKHRRRGIEAFKQLHKLNLALYASVSKEELVHDKSGEYKVERCYKFTFYSQSKRRAY
ncbi:MAG: hypothetical protein GWP03_04505 [Proteobacteria bacterium]|nr:hypothetical protein [Pseudomonadota bacterium]